MCVSLCVHVCNYFRTTKCRYAKINIYFEAHLSWRVKAASEIFNQFADNAPQATTLSTAPHPHPFLCSSFSAPLAPVDVPPWATVFASAAQFGEHEKYLILIKAMSRSPSSPPPSRLSPPSCRQPHRPFVVLVATPQPPSGRLLLLCAACGMQQNIICIFLY